MSENAGINLVADVGGTNTRVGLARGATLQQDSVRKYPNAQHDGLEAVLRKFLAETDCTKVDATCVAVAGPVTGDAGELTNLAWSFSRASLGAATGAGRVEILNDLQAQGHGLDGLDPARVKTLFAGRPAKTGAARLVVGVGTGFNIAPVFMSADGKIVPPSESGHGPLPVSTELELDLSRHLTQHFGYPEVEEALSGRGLGNLYRFFAEREGSKAQKDAAQVMASMAAQDDPIANKAVEQFVRTLAITMGNLAMIQMPFGGIYLIGGVARAVSAYFDEFDFLKVYQEKGRFSDLMQAFAVHVVEDDFAALFGCAEFVADGDMQSA